MPTQSVDLSQYKLDSRGRFIPIDSIKPIDLERDTLVLALVQEAKLLSNSLRTFRGSANADVQAFVDLSAEKYDIKRGGEKGNLTLLSYDGRYKVERAISEVLVFDERLQAAKKLIDECIIDWSRDSGKEIRTLITDAFRVDARNRINTKRILSLRQFNFDHPKWQQAMEAISDSLNVACSRSYLRFYERDERGNYQPICLDLANANHVLPASEEVQP